MEHSKDSFESLINTLRETGIVRETDYSCPQKAGEFRNIDLTIQEGVKYDEGKPRMDLIPPEMLEALGDVLGHGAEKYSERNWENGMDWGRPYAACIRHLNSWWSGEDVDPESGRSHLHHAACCIAFLIAFEQRCIGQDTRA